MSDAVKELVTAIGAISETLGLLRESLIKNGFTRQEAVQMCNTYLATTVSNGKNNQNDD